MFSRFVNLFNPFSNGKLKNSIFEIPVILQTLNIHYRVYQPECHKKAYRISFKNFFVKAMFTLTVFKILMFKGRLVLWPTQCVTRSERVKWKTQHKSGWSALWAIHMPVHQWKKQPISNKNNYSFQNWNKSTCSKLTKKLIINISQ